MISMNALEERIGRYDNIFSNVNQFLSSLLETTIHNADDIEHIFKVFKTIKCEM